MWISCHHWLCSPWMQISEQKKITWRAREYLRIRSGAHDCFEDEMDIHIIWLLYNINIHKWYTWTRLLKWWCERQDFGWIYTQGPFPKHPFQTSLKFNPAKERQQTLDIKFGPDFCYWVYIYTLRGKFWLKHRHTFKVLTDLSKVFRPWTLCSALGSSFLSSLACSPCPSQLWHKKVVKLMADHSHLLDKRCFRNNQLVWHMLLTWISQKAESWISTLVAISIQCQQRRAIFCYW